MRAAGEGVAFCVVLSGWPAVVVSGTWLTHVCIIAEGEEGFCLQECYVLSVRLGCTKKLLSLVLHVADA